MINVTVVVTVRDAIYNVRINSTLCSSLVIAVGKTICRKTRFLHGPLHGNLSLLQQFELSDSY